MLHFILECCFLIGSKNACYSLLLLPTSVFAKHISLKFHRATACPFLDDFHSSSSQEKFCTTDGTKTVIRFVITNLGRFSLATVNEDGTCLKNKTKKTLNINQTTEVWSFFIAFCSEVLMSVHLIWNKKSAVFNVYSIT